MNPAHLLCSLGATLLAANALLGQSAIAPLATFGTNGWLAPGSSAFLTTTNTERGMAFNPATGNLVLVSRNGGNNVRILSGATGADLGGLDVTGVTGGTFAINCAGVAEDGSIYVCNLSTSAASNFKVYSWASEAAGATTPPVVAYDALSGIGRTGDSFAVTGGFSGPIQFAASGSNPNNGLNSCFVIGPVDGTSLSTAYGPVAGTQAGTNDYRLGLTWVDANTIIGTQGANARMTAFAGPAATLLDTIPTGATERAMDYAVVGGIPCLAILNSATSDLTIYDISVPGSPVALLTANATSGVLSGNTNGTGAVAWGPISGNTATLYAMNSNQGIQAFSVTIQPAASSVAYGSGCGGNPASIYERFLPSTSFDLSNAGVSLVSLGGSGYLVQQSLAAYVAPSAAATSLGLGDDTAGTVALSSPFSYPGGSTSTLEVCSNGFVSVAAGNGTSYQPSPAGLLARPFPSYNCWHDFICNATNNVWFEEVGGIAYITWLNVVGYSGTAAGVTPSTFQFQFDLATGNVDIVCQAMDNVSINGFSGADGYVVGYSPGNGALDPGSTDLSGIVAPVLLPGADLINLTLSSSAAPVLGALITLDLTGIAPTAPIVLYALGLQDIPGGFPLAAPVQAGCSAYLLPVLTNFVFSGGASSSQLPQAFPLDPAFVGLEVFAQGLALDTSGAITTSNGLRLYLENF